MTKEEKTKKLNDIKRIIDMDSILCKNFPDNEKFAEELQDAKDAYKAVEAENTED